MRSEPPSQAPEGRQNVAHGVGRRDSGRPPFWFRPIPSPGGATEGRAFDSVAPPGLGNAGRESRPTLRHPWLTPWATFCRPSAAGLAGVLSFLVSTALLAGCAAVRVDPPVAALPGNADDPHGRMEFWADLGRRPVVSNADALHALLLYLDGTDPAADYAGRVAALKARGL